VTSELRGILFLVLVQDAALVALTVVLFWIGVFGARRLFGSKAGYSLAALGLRRPRFRPLVAAGIGVLAGLAALFMSIIASGVSVLVLRSLGYPAENSAQEPLMQGLRAWIQGSPLIAIPVTVLIVVVLVPAVEELVFRGAIFGGLRNLALLVLRRVGGEGDSRVVRVTAIAAAAVISSVFFALLHLSPVIITGIFLLSLVLCALYDQTRSLLSSFIAHATFNSFTTLILILTGLGALDLPS
jgi:membrane protease YdiL (CAAX protease family)